MQIIKNVNVVNPHRIIKNVSIVIKDGKIIDIVKTIDDICFDEFCTVIDGENLFASSGFIDIHVHGGGLKGVMETSKEDIVTMCYNHAKFGTTSILPTTFAAPLDMIYDSIINVKNAQKICKVSNILGIHLEGPYFAKTQKGAQSSDYIQLPIYEKYKELIELWDGIRIMGVAPEIEGGMKLGRELSKRGIIPSIAHSDATYDECIEAYENGYRDITHIYSGCSTVTRKNAYRIAGVVEAGLMIDEFFVQVIADGKHLPPSLLQMIYKQKGADKICLITDGLEFSASNIKQGEKYLLKNGIEVVLDDGVMKLSDKQSFAGSVATSNILVRNMMKLANASLIDAVKMATWTPARFLNINNSKGMISKGYDADIVLFDDNIDTFMTMVKGKIVFNNLKSGK